MLDPELVSEFVAESLEHLEDVEPLLLEMEKRGAASADSVNEMFRAVHSIKGAAGFLGLEAIQQLSHGMESVFMSLRDGELAFRAELGDPLLEGVDGLRGMLRALRDNADEQAETPDELVATLLALVSEEGRTEDPAPEPGVLDATAACRAQLDRGHHVVVIPLPRLEAERAAFLEQVDRYAELVRAQAPRRGQAIVGSPLDPDLLAEALGLAADAVQVFDPAAQPEEVAPRGRPRARRRDPPAELPVEGADRRAETVRVQKALLDKLMDLAGELVLGRNQLRRFLHPVDDRFARALFQNVDRITSQLQENIMRARMQPIHSLFDRLPRLVRDLGHRLGKEVDLELVGGEIELDRSIIEALADPLTHLIRNSLDHGIEDSGGRGRLGKPERGRIRVTAFHERGRVVIEISDDGRGIDAERVRAAAVAHGVISEERAQVMDEREALDLIFCPGISTAHEVTSLSGRGVGLDVVKTNIEQLGGQVELETTAGEGSRFVIHLPLTLAILPSLVVSVAGERFAIPQVSLVEVVGIGDGESPVEVIRGAEVMRLRGQLIPLVRLRSCLGLPPDPRSESGVVVLRSDAHEYGLVVDELHDGEEIVVKPLPGYLAECGWYAGATILGDGTVAMILDAVGIARAASIRFDEAREQRAPSTPRAPSAPSRSLVLFSSNANEQFALPLAELHRLEQVSRDRVEWVGSRSFVQHRGRSIALVHLDEVLPVAGASGTGERFYLLIPRAAQGEESTAGIVAERIVDTLETDVVPDPSHCAGPGLLGSAIVEGRLTLFLDSRALLDHAGVGGAA